MIKILRVLNRLEGVLKLTEIKIMRNSEWPPFMGHNWSPWYVFDQGTPANDISDITIKKMGRDTLFRPFFKIAATKIKFGQYSSSNLHRVIILVSTPMFSWATNRMKPLIKRLGYSYIETSKKSKMAALRLFTVFMFLGKRIDCNHLKHTRAIL